MLHSRPNQAEVLQRAEKDPVEFVKGCIGHAVLQDLAVDPHSVTHHAVDRAIELTMRYAQLFGPLVEINQISVKE